MDQRLRLVADFQNNASSGVKRLAKDLGAVKPTTGMAAAQKWFSEFRGGAEKTVDAVKPVSGLLSGVGLGGLAASLSMGELVKQFRELADSTATMKELGRQSSMTTTEIARLQYAAGKLHVDPAAMSGAIGSWSSKMVEFRMHTSQFYRDLMRQNSDVAAKIESDSPVDGLKRALDFISRIKDPQIQKRWADDAGLGDLVPMLAKGPEGLAEAYAEATREVKPLSKELEQQAEKLNESINRLDTTWANFKREFGPTVIGGISGAVDQLKAVLDEVDAAKQRYSGHPENVTKDATANENAIGSNFMKHWQEVIRGERPILPNPFDSRSWHFPNVKDGLFDYTKGGDGEAPSGITLSKPGQTRFGEDGNALHRWDEMPAGSPPSASAKWKVPARYDAEARARGNSLAAVPAHELFATVREGSKEGIIAGLREMAQQQELGGGGSGVGETTGGASNLRYGRSGASGAFRTTPGRHSGGSAGGDHGTTGPNGIDYNAKSAQEQMKISKGEWDAFREGVTDIEGKRYDRMGGGGGRYAGRYQMGPAEITATAARLGVPRPSNAQFLADPAMQERFFENYTMDHRRSLMHDPKFAALSAREQLKILGYAHNQGAGGPANSRHGANGAWGYLENGRAGHDGFGTSGAAYPLKIQRRFDQLDHTGPATPGAGTPAPSAAAISDGDVFKARQRIINGSRDPADRALVDRYKAQQAKPEHHAAGGPIRGPGGPRSDSIPAWLSNGEFVVNAGAAGRFLPLLHAINGGHLPAFADGGPVGFGVDKRFYPTRSAPISAAEGLANRRSWRDFYRRSTREGGMGASMRATLGGMAMMAGESGYGLNTKTYGWDVDGPSGGAEQWHDVLRGPWAGKIRRLSDLMRFGMMQHADWTDRTVQQAFKRHEETTSFAGAWRRMLAAKTARGALKEGIDHIEIPADKAGELMRRAPNIVRLAREAAGDGAMGRHDADPVQIDIHHHPRTGMPIVTARGGRGTRLGIRTAPTMRPT